MSRIISIIPESLLPIASKIAMATDPDSGGAASYNIRTTNGMLIADAPASDLFAGMVGELIADAEVFQQFVASQMLTRFSDEVPPTLEEVERFLMEGKTMIALSLAVVLEQEGLEIERPQSTEV